MLDMQKELQNPDQISSGTKKYVPVIKAGQHGPAAHRTEPGSL